VSLNWKRSAGLSSAKFSQWKKDPIITIKTDLGVTMETGQGRFSILLWLVLKSSIHLRTHYSQKFLNTLKCKERMLLQTRDCRERSQRITIKIVGLDQSNQWKILSLIINFLLICSQNVINTFIQANRLSL
jgi:hypothetical protein